MNCHIIVTLEGVFLLLEQEVLVQVPCQFSRCCDRFFLYLISHPYINTAKGFINFCIFLIDEGNNFNKVKKHAWGHRVTECLLEARDGGCTRWSLFCEIPWPVAFSPCHMNVIIMLLMIIAANVYWVIGNYQTHIFLNLKQPVIKTLRFREGK